MKKLLLVDGLNLHFQMFFGMPARIVNAQGKAIQGVLGFVGALLKIIRMTQPTHLAVLFDGEHPYDRAELLAEYKQNRPDFSQVPAADNPFSQLEDVYAALRYLGIPHAELEEWETDDVIASYVCRYRGQAEITISSFDSDFFQLLGAGVRVLRYRGEKTALWDADRLWEKYGVRPDQYADFKALTGDKADNIRGADRVGVKTAAALLAQFGSLAAVLARADEIEKPAVRASIRQHASRLRTNYQLIKLGDRAALPFPLAALAYTDTGLRTGEVLRGIGLR